MKFYFFVKTVSINGRKLKDTWYKFSEFEIAEVNYFFEWKSAEAFMNKFGSDIPGELRKTKKGLKFCPNFGYGKAARSWKEEFPNIVVSIKAIECSPTIRQLLSCNSTTDDVIKYVRERESQLSEILAKEKECGTSTLEKILF